jgi:hypothetical protein
VVDGARDAANPDSWKCSLDLVRTVHLYRCTDVARRRSCMYNCTRVRVEALVEGLVMVFN